MDKKRDNTTVSSALHLIICDSHWTREPIYRLSVFKLNEHQADMKFSKLVVIVVILYAVLLAPTYFLVGGSRDESTRLIIFPLRSDKLYGVGQYIAEDIGVLDIRTGRVFVVHVGELDPQSLRVSRNGEILFRKGRELYWTNLAGTMLRKIEIGTLLVNHRWSPSGELVGFINHSNRDLYVFSKDGSTSTRLTNNRQISGFSWSPDSKRIAFTGQTEDSDVEIFIVELYSGAETQITDNQVTENFISWSFTGENAITSFSGDIYLIRLDTGVLRRLTSSGFSFWLNNRELFVTKRMYDERDTIIGEEFWTINTETGESTLVSSSTESKDFGIDVSPCGDQFLYLRRNAFDQHRLDVCVVDIVTNDQRCFDNINMYEYGLADFFCNT